MRTTEDALRSFKRYLALSLGQPTPPLAAAKWFSDPADFDPNATYLHFDEADFEGVFHVWFDLAPAGTLDAAPVDDPGLRAGLVPMGHWNGFTFWGNPPGRRFDSDRMALVPQPDDDSSCSPGLVAGCLNAAAPAWAEALSAPRWGFPPAGLMSGTGRRYRIAMLLDMPGDVATTLGAGIAADSLTDPDEWDVRFMHDPGEFQYPLCIVKPVGAAATQLHQFYMEVTQPFVVYAYPTPPDEAVANGSQAQLAAERVRQLLVTALGASRANGAKPMRLPLYDYDGLESAMPAGSRNAWDFLKVVDASVDLMPEPTDVRQPVVVADVRLNWRVAGDDGRGTVLAKALELDLVEE